jgi:hypothetical protein
VTLKSEILTDDIWICDSGACGHYCKSHKVLFDVEDINKKINEGNAKSMKTVKIGSLICHVIQFNGSSVNVTLNKVKSVPELRVNLFRISKSLKRVLQRINVYSKIDCIQEQKVSPVSEVKMDSRWSLYLIITLLKLFYNSQDIYLLPSFILY